jgi:predicted RNA binding protein YcfA (HicA-like mRNA interferase family)
MKSISGKKLCKIVEKKGWILKKITGSHHIYEKTNENKIISIPVHRNQDLKLGTLKSIMKMTQLLEDDL